MENSIRRLAQPGGKTLAWNENSGVELIEQEGFFFKDLERTGQLLPFEDWRLPPEDRAADHPQADGRRRVRGKEVVP